MRRVTDQTGRAVEVPTRIDRIITLAPSLTEIIYALGLGDRLVGVSNECDYPPAVRQKTRVGEVINPNLEIIVELKPDVVLATTSGNRRQTVDALDRLRIPLYGLNAETVNDIFLSIRQVAELAGVPGRGRVLARDLADRLVALTQQLDRAPKPQVLFAIWLDPLITTGSDTFLNDVINQAGATSVTAGLRVNWPQLSLEEVVELDPDFIVLTQAHNLQARMAQLSSQNPWNALRAVQENRVVWLDEAALRPGPRIVEMIEQLARALHPQLAPAEVAVQ